MRPLSVEHRFDSCISVQAFEATSGKDESLRFKSAPTPGRGYRFHRVRPRQNRQPRSSLQGRHVLQQGVCRSACRRST